jgi:hypothetical protein
VLEKFLSSLVSREIFEYLYYDTAKFIFTVGLMPTAEEILHIDSEISYGV